MVSRRGVLGFVTTGVTASLLTWMAVGEDPPVSVDVDIDEETAETVSDATEVNTSLAGAGDTNTNSNWRPKTAARAAHKIVNEERASAGRGELAWREDVAAAAREYAEKLATADKLTHTLDGSQPGVRYSAAGIGRYSGENANAMPGWGYDIHSATVLAQQTVGEWMDSEGHRENILSFGNRTEGIGFAKNSDNTVYAVQVFTR
jgi:Uncharacterized protein with SCP/PR1 domains